MIVVDANVIAYLLIEGDRMGEAQMLRLDDPDWRSEPILLVEFSNLLAPQVRAKALSVAQASSLLESTSQLIPDGSTFPMRTRWLQPSTAKCLPTMQDSRPVRGSSRPRW